MQERIKERDKRTHGKSKDGSSKGTEREKSEGSKTALPAKGARENVNEI